MCMREEVEQAIAAIDERDDKCKIDMERIETKVASSDALKI
jgi:primosomal protein N''